MPKLVANWHQCLKWLSVQLAAVSIALQGALLMLPDSIRAYLPEWSTRYAAIFLLLAVVAGRLIDQSKPYVPAK